MNYFFLFLTKEAVTIAIYTTTVNISIHTQKMGFVKYELEQIALVTHAER